MITLNNIIFSTRRKKKKEKEIEIYTTQFLFLTTI
jgi:hypothetical protein